MHINAETSCSLCRKEVCTTANIPGAYTVVLQHFTDDCVFSIMVEALKLLLSCNKCNNAQGNNSIKFVKAGAKLSKYTKKATLWPVTPYCWLEVTKTSR